MQLPNYGWNQIKIKCRPPKFDVVTTLIKITSSLPLWWELPSKPWLKTVYSTWVDPSFPFTPWFLITILFPWELLNKVSSFLQVNKFCIQHFLQFGRLKTVPKIQSDSSTAVFMVRDSTHASSPSPAFTSSFSHVPNFIWEYLFGSLSFLTIPCLIQNSCWINHLLIIDHRFFLNLKDQAISLASRQHNNVVYYVHKLSIANKIKESGYKILSQWYRVPMTLHKCYPQVPPVC